jgi:aspartokinase/homoserine dehydrogenase 1
MLSGDRVIKIEAVLSGTLSYIFNSFVPGTSFSDVVKVAKDQGFTEPDPRDDLSGTDVARKLLILSRDMGIPLELGDIEVESLVPENCRDCKSSEDFLNKLPESDSYFDDKLSAAANSGQVLRYIGIIENGKARVALEAVDQNHPFYSLSGSDNIISFVTERYLERPLVVKGPGAGTDVTAAGVLADIVRAASYLAF